MCGLECFNSLWELWVLCIRVVLVVCESPTVVFVSAKRFWVWEGLISVYKSVLVVTVIDQKKNNSLCECFYNV